jgi:cytochrome c oxidase assembly factor CtaG
VLSRLSRGRIWLAVIAAALILVSLVPPAGIYARRLVFVETLQFLVFAVAGPALLVLGAPWRPLGRLLPWRGPGGRRPARLRRGSEFRRAAAVLVAFIAAVIVWRLPVTVNALARVPGLAVVEMLTLVGAGTALWLELVESPPMLPHLSRPQRAGLAALTMWTIWILGYILGFSQVAWFVAYGHAAGLGVVADQEIATGLMWGVPAVCFMPVVFVTALTWLKDTEDPDEGLRAMIRAERRPPGRGRWPRPPRGWHTPSA